MATNIDKERINRYKSLYIESLFGWKPDEVKGKEAWDLVHPDDILHAQLFFSP